MGIGNQSDDQSQVFVMCADLPRSPGHVFYDRLQSVLIKGGFDRFVEKLCEPYYASGPGRKSIPPGRYFRMHLVGYFEGIESERGLEWRCSDSLSLRKFLRLSLTQRVPDHSSLSRIRQRLPLEVHQEVSGWVLQALTKFRPGSWGTSWHRRLDHGSQRGHALDRAPGYRRNIPADA